MIDTIPRAPLAPLLALSQAAKNSRVFAHYVLGRLAFLFFMCHPGTLATFSDGQAYLLNRYPNRDLVTTEGQLVSAALRIPTLSLETCAPPRRLFLLRVEECSRSPHPPRRVPRWCEAVADRCHATFEEAPYLGGGMPHPLPPSPGF